MENSRAFPQVIKIGNRLVGEGQPTFFIAEIGANFDGSLEKAKRLIDAAKEAGADVAKFQTFQSEKIVSGPSFAKLKGGLKGVHGSWDKPIDVVFKEAEFPREWHKELAEYCQSKGIMFSSAPYDFEAADLMEEAGVEFYKIGSGEINNPELLSYIANKGKPVILATGDATMSEIDEAIKTIEATGNRNLILLQCITNYPSKIESANIRVIQSYQQLYGIITGYSDHSPGDLVTLGTVALGGKVIEKHFTLNKKDPGPDHPHSMEPAEFKALVDRTRLLEAALGSPRKEPVEEETETVIVQRRSCHTTRPVKAGEVLKAEDIVALRPAIGIPPRDKEVLIGKTVKVDLGQNEAITWDAIG